MMSCLLCGRDVGVVEDRHRLRAGEHGLVDVRAASTSLQGRARTCRGSARRRRRRSCGTWRSWCGTARRPWRRRRSRRGRTAASGMAGPGASEATYAASCVDLLVGELDAACAWPATPGVGQRHPAGADLEVDRGGADADQASGRPCVPWALRPWQVAQLARKSFLPVGDRRRRWPSAPACAGSGATSGVERPR